MRNQGKTINVFGGKAFFSLSLFFVFLALSPKLVLAAAVLQFALLSATLPLVDILLDTVVLI